MEPRQGAPELPHINQPLEQGERYGYDGNQVERAGEASHETVANTPPRIESEGLPPVVVPLPAPVQPMQDTVQLPDDQTSSNPAAAADEDLIEKEWIDKIKKVIEATKENPYKRELEIGKLQRDYIRKRYGREIGAPGDR